MRGRLAGVRRAQGRSTVALVLSGGGAKGAAEVGVLRFLEEEGIPVDFICGTSIGGLVGGMYSIGYRAADLEKLFTTQDWPMMLGDRVDRRYFSYARKQYKATYQLSIPFHYRREDYLARMAAGQIRPGAGKLHIGAQEADSAVGKLLGSLPSGYVNGHHVNNLLSSLTVRYQDSLSFADLPVPFMCVASDLVSCKARNWGAGNFKTALRSTMSIPVLFEPVRTDGMVLVDGGLRNNFPTDIARATGADYIIGIDLSDADPDFSQVNNVGDIMMRIVSATGSDSFNRNIGGCDLLVKPDLTGYNMLSFHAEDIDTMLVRGYRAAQAKAAEIRALKARLGHAAPAPETRAALDISVTPVRLSVISFEGVSEREARYLTWKIRRFVGTVVGKQELDIMLSRIHGTGAFESVTWSLLGADEPYHLVFKCVRRPVHQFGASVRIDTEEWASFLFNFGLFAHKLLGPKVDISAEIGVKQAIGAKFTLDLPALPALNAEAQFYNRTMSVFLPEGDRVYYDFPFAGHTEKLYLSNMQLSSLDIRAGVASRSFVGTNPAVFRTLGYDRSLLDGGYFGAFLCGYLNTFDHAYFPTEGCELSFGYDGDFFKYGVPSFRPVHAARFDFKGVFPFDGRVSLIPDFHLRSVFDAAAQPFAVSGVKSAPQEAFSFARRNFVGGTFSGRYLEQQVPFVGFNHVMACFEDDGYGHFHAYDHLAVLNADFRVTVLPDLFLSALFGYMRMAETLPALFSVNSRSYWGVGLQASYRSFFGPLSARLQWSNRYREAADNVSFYISMGFDF